MNINLCYKCKEQMLEGECISSCIKCGEEQHDKCLIKCEICGFLVCEECIGANYEKCEDCLIQNYFK